MVFPGMVYISHPTEYGTLYSKEELRNLSEVCKEHHIPLFMDGARLGYGLMSNETDVTIEDIANYCDIFILVVQRLVHYVVKRLYLQTIMNLNTSLRIKQHGALLAKGRLVGIQFLELFTNNLYFDISRHAINMANKMKQGFINKGYKVYFDSPTNQQFSY